MNTRILAAALSFISFCGPAMADEETRSASSLWVTSGFLSKHTTNRHAPRRGWNESNTGIGVEYAFDGRWRVAGGVYENSVYRTSRYAQLVWSPELTTGRCGDWTAQLGVAVGAVDGYPRMGGGGYFLTVLPVASLQWKHVGVNLTDIPSLAGNVAGAVALQAELGFI